MGSLLTNKKKRKNNLQIKEKEKEVGKEINIQRKKKIYKYNIVFIGEANTGTKTSLIKRIKEGKYTDISNEEPEISEKIIYEKDDKEILLYLIDSNNIKKEKNNMSYKDENEKRNLVCQYFENADCIIMGYDATNKQSFEEIKSYWYNKIKEIAKTNLIYLLGNKIDLKDNIKISENEGKEFADKNNIKYFSISVKNDININNFIDDIKMNIEKIDNIYDIGINETIYGNPSKKDYKVVLFGDSGIGSKTSLINRLISNTFEIDILSTNGASFVSKDINLRNGKKIILNIWDTAGQERYRQLTKIFTYDCDCIILGYDITRKGSFENIKNDWYPMSKKNSIANLYYLLGNKMDLIKEKEVDENEVRNYAKENNIRFFPISCLENTGIYNFLQDLSNEIIKI